MSREGPSPTPTARPSLADWCGHGLRAGAVLGVFLSVFNALGVRLGATPDGSRPVKLVELAASVAVTTAATALALASLGLLTWFLLRSSTGRRVALGLHATLAICVAAVHLLSSVLRMMSGAYLTRGALEFVLAGDSHLLHTIVAGYARYFAALVTCLMVVGLAVVLFGRRALARARFASERVRLASPTAALGVPLGLAGAGLLPAGLVGGLSLVSPELALAGSFGPEPIDSEPLAPPSGPEPTAPAPRLTAPEGPPQTEGERWRERVSRLSRKTNVIVMTLESISAQHLGFMGYERDTTPNLDRIARRSMRMRRAWSTATHSNYAQMAVLSSLFPRRTTGLDVYKRLDYPRHLLHDVFHALDYDTATVSSQDETWQGMLRFQQTGTPTYYRHSRDYSGTRLDIGSELVVLDHVTVDMATEWMRGRGQKPWAIYVNFQATHFPYRLQAGIPTPFQPTKLTPGRFNYLSYPESDRQAVINRYDNALHYVDEQIGKLESFLERSGKLEETLWVITADHGENFHDHGQVTHGRTLYDTEARVPLLVHWPKRVPAGDVDEPVSTLDVLPTVLDLLEVPPHPSFQGHSFRDPSARAGEPVGIYLNIQGLRSAEAIVCWPWKLIVDRSAHTTRLFNLDENPEENVDRSEQDAPVAEALRKVLGAQVASQLDYHGKGNAALGTHYAPRLLACPALPGVPRAAAPP